ncbi:hypothetical protein, partial [Tessaracoccus defluvii]|uniref:hypothetical protein n=1 Tax=Tessaracoccus defluvii TaxID=1285901 RepID=UPI0031CDF456
HRTNRLRLEFRAELLPGHSIPSISPTDSTGGGSWSGNNPSPQIGELELGRRPNDDLAHRYREWLTAA